MCKWQRVIPTHKGSPRYRITHGWKNGFGSFNLETLKFLMHFRELGFHFILFLYHTYSYFFLFSFFLLSFFLSFFLFSSLFLFAPLELYNCIVPTSSPMFRRLLVLRKRGDSKVGTRNNFPLERKPWHHLVIFLELVIHPQ
jgi:hypothetical protein